MLHHPFLFGEIPKQSQATSKEFLAPLPGRKRSLLRAYRRRRGYSIIIYKVPNHKSDLLAITSFSICLSFSSPPLHQFAVLFALFFVCLFLAGSLALSLWLVLPLLRVPPIMR